MFKKFLSFILLATVSAACTEHSGNDSPDKDSTATVSVEPLKDYPGYLGDKKVYYGAAYYPEAYNLEGVEEDIRRMKECNMNVMRMAEFSWSLMEPEEGKFEFAWLHKIVEKLHENGISVILGTPTATPPGWAAEKYPEMFLTNEDGQQEQHGHRRACDFRNPKYNELCDKIVEQMAKEFGNKPGVIGWQTDNEFSVHYDYSEHARKEWPKWLKNRYGSLENLNKLWVTNLWSQKYSSFEMIPMPKTTVWHHPSLRMAWYRFNNEAIIEFQDRQVAILRKYSNQPITHDGMPGQAVNYEKLFENLDFVATNNYHSFEAYDRVFSNYDRCRGYGKGYHWLFETTPNYSGGGDKGQTWFLHQPDGSFHAALWMNHALGGQGSMFWLWRQQPAGHEMVHGSVMSSWNQPAANYQDIIKLGADLQKTSDFQMNAPVPLAQIGIFWSHENLMGLKIEENANGINYYSDWTSRFYHSLTDVYLHRDVLNPGVDISGYKILFAPLMPYIPNHLKDRLKTWVNNGGTLVLGPMSGYRTEEWSAYTDFATGDLENAFSYNVLSRIPVGIKRRDAETPLMLNFMKPAASPSTEATLWSEALAVKEGGTVLATYTSGMHKGKPAIVESPVGKGKVIYLGTDPGKVYLSELFLRLAAEKGIAPLATGDAGVVAAPRKGTQEGIILDNVTGSVKTLQVPGLAGTDLLTGEPVGSKITLRPFEVKVIKTK